MKRKLTTRIIAVLSAMVTAVTMMATSASAETYSGSWKLKKEPNGANSYLLYLTFDDVYMAKELETQFQINCSYFYPATNVGASVPYVSYWTFVTTAAYENSAGYSVEGIGFTAKEFHAVCTSYKTYTLETQVKKGYCLQIRGKLIDYNNVTSCLMYGAYKVP